jgi:hypothetical protein
LAGNDTVTLGSGAASVFGAQSDTINAGPGASTVVLGSGAESINLSAGHGSANLFEIGVTGTDTVTGFTETIGPGTGDFININHSTDTVTAIMSGATSTTVNSTPSTVLHFHDGTTMTVVGFSPSQVHSDFFK